MGRTRSVRDRAAMYREREPKGVAPSYTITVTWPRGRVQQVHRKTKDQAREIAEAIELKGARVKVIEWRGSPPSFPAAATITFPRPVSAESAWSKEFVPSWPPR